MVGIKIWLIEEPFKRSRRCVKRKANKLAERIFAPPDEEEIRRFMALSVEDRLRWLEAKEFIFSTMPPESRKIWELLQQIKSE